MTVELETIKKLIHQVENTIFREGQNSLVIPILLDDLTDLKYDDETVKTYNIYFKRIDGVWHIEI